MGRKEIRISGFGGQGVVLAGSIVGKAASLFSNKYATLTQNYGPESRGGSSAAEVVISDEPIDYPYVTQPQVQIIMSQEAFHKYGRNAPYGMLIIIDGELVRVHPGVDPQPLRISASRLAMELGRPVVANIIMLGFLAAVSDIVPVDALKKSILDSIPKGTEELNMKAFELGYKHGIEQKEKTK